MRIGQPLGQVCHGAGSAWWQALVATCLELEALLAGTPTREERVRSGVGPPESFYVLNLIRDSKERRGPFRASHPPGAGARTLRLSTTCVNQPRHNEVEP